MNSSPRLRVDRRLVVRYGLATAIVTTVVALYRPEALRSLDADAYDVVVRQAGSSPAGGRIAIVDIDEHSLSAIGQWPWRRDVIARLIGRLQEMGAGTIALDVLFAEPDRFEASAEQADPTSISNDPTPSDVRLAGALGSGRIVLGYALTFDDAASRPAGCVLHPLNAAILQPPRDGNPAPLFRASGVVCALPVLARAAAGSGFLNATTDADGILRRVPLLMELDGRLYPGLALAAVMAASGARDVTLRVENANAAALIVGDRAVPLDGKGNLLLRHRGARRSFGYIAASDVLTGRAAADAVRDKMVFLGATALGAREVVATAFDAHVPGVEIQATVADNLLRQDFIRRTRYAAMLELQIALAATLGVVALVARAGLGWGVGGAAMAIVLLWRGSTWQLSSAGEFVSPLLPTLGIVSALAAAAAATIVSERRRGEHAWRTTAASRRLLIQSLLSLTEARDPETGQHASRTQRYTRLLAEQLASHPKFHAYLTPERIDLIATLAPLHDIGKVAIPDRLLNKPGALTGDEVAEMRKHPAYGRDVIVQAERRAGAAGDPILAMAKEIVYTHHERWDGSGYPQGLVDEQIPISGRLVALVDVYDALTTKRVYRQPIPPGAAVDLIVQARGTQFDPAVVDAFLQVVPVLAAGPPDAAARV